ncbi:MAG: MazG-like family protein [Patescibacteria group bacterium]|nr:MazG-like family protein [Patescibacteria group bacterium]
MKQLEQMTKEILDFNKERDWIKFFTPKDLLLAMIIEAGELGDHLVWDRSSKEYFEKHKEIIEDEFSDTFSYMLLLANELNIDIESVFKRKLEKTKLKYPIEKSKGHTTKYSELDNI